MYKLIKVLKKKYGFVTMILLGIIIIIIINSINNNNSNSNILLSSFQDEHIFTICIDAGHGDWDLGASGIYADEKDINLAVALELGALLEASEDINVVYTREDDFILGTTATESLEERVTLSNQSNADLFISIHCNSYPYDISVSGVETWYNPTDLNGEYFASLVQEKLSDLNYTSNRGIITYAEGDELYVLNHTDASSILIELGFITNPYDEEYLYSSLGQSQCAAAIYNATLDYINWLNNDTSS